MACLTLWMEMLLRRGLLPVIPVLLWSVQACRPPAEDSVPPHQDDSGAPPDDTDNTGDTGDTGDTGEVLSPYLDGALWYQAKAVPPGVGYAWSLDEEFSMPGYTVPSFLVLHGGAGYLMFLTDMVDRGSIYQARSTDGLSWTVEPAPILTPEDYDGACGPELLDVSQVYLSDGTYRLLVESYDQPTNRTTLCSAWSDDGDTWIAEEGVRYAGSEEDCGTTSVLGVLWYRPLEAWLIYYVADWCSTDGNAIRAAISTDGWEFEPWQTENLLSQGRVDPEPVRVEGDGGVRLYHSMWQQGHPGLAESPDAISFTDLGALPTLDDNAYHGGSSPEPGDICRYDPAYLRLPDGRMYLYFGSFETDELRQTLPYIRRALVDDAR